MPNFPDYPKLGIWPDVYYMSMDLYTGQGYGGKFLGAYLCAFDRLAMRQGLDPRKTQCFQLTSAFASLLPSDLDGNRSSPPNAMTFPDKTCYPVASQNVQDFYNLIDVYLDAVFFPRLTPQLFQQEGWHYELDAPDAPLIYKGVVFNEMKGQ